jgi:hypothetical protein
VAGRARPDIGMSVHRAPIAVRIDDWMVLRVGRRGSVAHHLSHDSPPGSGNRLTG